MGSPFFPRSGVLSLHRSPLTPAFSRGEREKRSPCSEQSRPLDGSQWVRLLFPLPPGEGQGEGRAQQAGLMRRSGLEVGSAVGPKGRMALRHIIYPKSAALPEYVFSVFDAWLPLPARDERGEGRGGGSPSLTLRCASSPRPSPPAGEEREKRQLRNAKHVRLSSRQVVALSRCARG